MEKGDQESWVQKINIIRTTNGIEQTFNQGLDYQTLLALLQPKVLKAFQQKIWDILSRDYVFYQWETIIFCIKTSPVLEILLNCHENPKIMKSLSHSQFRCLKELSLNSNKIQSIQILPFLHAQNLEMLSLSKNLITNFKPLTKTKWSNFKTLMIDLNLAPKLQLNRLKAGKIFGAVRLDLYNKSLNNMIYDLRQLIHLESQQIQIGRSRKMMTVNQEQFCVLLRQKYLNIQICAYFY